jgi:hypothetical protein
MNDTWEPTNAALMIIDSETPYGFIAIDPLGDTWIEARPVLNLCKGRGRVPTLRSCGQGVEIWFVSLDWLIRIYPDSADFRAARDGLIERVRRDGFESDDF